MWDSHIINIWLVKTPCIIHFKQLLVTKFVILNWWLRKCNPLQIIEPMTKMTSKVQPATDYWTIDWGGGCVIFVKQKNKTITTTNNNHFFCFVHKILYSKKRELIFSFKGLKIFWMDNKAINEFGSHRIGRILQISEAVRVITLAVPILAACRTPVIFSVFSSHVIKIENRNHSMNKVKNLGYDGWLLYWHPRQESGLYCFSFGRYVPAKSKLKQAPPPGIWRLFLAGREGIWSPLIGGGKFNR